MPQRDFLLGRTKSTLHSFDFLLRYGFLQESYHLHFEAPPGSAFARKPAPGSVKGLGHCGSSKLEEKGQKLAYHWRKAIMRIVMIMIHGDTW